MVDSTTTILTLEDSQGSSLSGRIGQIQPYELLIFFILVVLLALCLFVAQVVVQDVDTTEKQQAAPLLYVTQPEGLNTAFAWGV